MRAVPRGFRVAALALTAGALLGCAAEGRRRPETPHIVFLVGDHEYRSEESMPMLASILESEFGFRTSLCFARNEAGEIAPDRADHLDGLEAVASADLLVVFLRFRALPEPELTAILNHTRRGKPVVGFRTSTHAFGYPDTSPLSAPAHHWPDQIFGAHWITHHGHFGDNHEQLTSVSLPASEHPILRGVGPFEAYSWLYHVEGGSDRIAGEDVEVLAHGTARKTSYANDPRFPTTQPVAWTRSYKSPDGSRARVFFTTLGHPYDFRELSMRRLAVHGVLWALGLERAIPTLGARAVPPHRYEPSPSGEGAYRRGLRAPADGNR